MKLQAGQTAFVTGGASGIGRGMAKAFARRGMNVVIADIEQAALGEAAEAMRRDGLTVESMVLDVSEREAVEAAAARTVERFGKVHVTCNNVGVVVADPLGAIAEPDWRWIVDVNLRSVVYGVEAFVPYIRAHKEGGHIVNTASIAGLLGYPGFSPYAATKFGVVGLTEAWRAQLAPEKIGFSVLCPGAVATRIFDSRRNQQESYGGAGSGSRGDDRDRASVAAGLAPEVVGEYVRDCVEADELYIVTHNDFRPLVEMAMQTRMDAFDFARFSTALQGRAEEPLPTFF